MPDSFILASQRPSAIDHPASRSLCKEFRHLILRRRWLVSTKVTFVREAGARKAGELGVLQLSPGESV